MNSRLTALKADRIVGVSYPICVTCGVQYGGSVSSCPVCEDPRQYVPVSGQAWTSLEALRVDHRNRFDSDHGVLGVGTTPKFGIGQRALLVEDVLWDCITLLDEETIERIGSLRAIAISHPHYYSSMVEWAHAFDCPVLIHEADREWVMRPDARVEYWSGETYDLGAGMTLIRCGGHFAGGTVLHLGADFSEVDPASRPDQPPHLERPPGGDLFAGDIVQVIPDRQWVAFMYSFPNYIPLPAAAVRAVGAALEPFAFERIYGAWWEAVIEADGSGIVRRSVERYVAALDGYLP
ncbi:MBL fold metallo-hydrolase [Solirubrobacter sp. CPCC 204708]|uniref:MBL fold metallo-hydrolase n=1 Tax=Solirubrobacter deserti TaxID=2282478 RepID=A0ABT4RH82_9ACTN|nr:hypothetical protein [Solirubrobacter deserti]MBE2315226.1 MBL fold metallo-hydrolase [Solirubrobacter deserti]MDA0137910.1 hypothetical protein [Solirubrobacter deserti]